VIIKTDRKNELFERFGGEREHEKVLARSVFNADSLCDNAEKRRICDKKN
jgi:hypothetical protein